MAVTRGSRSEIVQGPDNSIRTRTSSLRGWGTRLSGEWVSRLRNVSRSPANGRNYEPSKASQKATGKRLLYYLNGHFADSEKISRSKSTFHPKVCRPQLWYPGANVHMLRMVEKSARILDRARPLCATRFHDTTVHHIHRRQRRAIAFLLQ